MKAMILAAGLGTRLKPWTLEHPKALVPVGGVPMLKRVIDKLIQQGFDDITVNIHHFGEQITDFLEGNDFKAKINVSDERGCLLETGGGIVHAAHFLCSDDSPFLVHNVDILSNADLENLVDCHKESGNDVTLLVSGRDSSRKLMFDENGILRGWHHLSKDIYRPESAAIRMDLSEAAFSGIYVMSPRVVRDMEKYSGGAFSIMDFFLDNMRSLKIGRVYDEGLNLIDIGKPETLSRADHLFL